MKKTTSNKHERFGADAIHFKIENEKPIIILGEAKTVHDKLEKYYVNAMDFTSAAVFAVFDKSASKTTIF